MRTITTVLINKKRYIYTVFMLLCFCFAFNSQIVSACTIANWTGGANGSVTTDGKSYEGTCAVKFVIGSLNSLTDLSPNGEKTYSAGFYAFMGEMSLGSSDEVIIFSAGSNNTNSQIRVVVARSGEEHHAHIEVYEDNNITQSSPSEALLYGWNFFVITWSASSAPGSNDGSGQLTLNETQTVSVSNLDNDQGVINQARLGSVDGTMGASMGFFDSDLFASRRNGVITPYQVFNDVTNNFAEQDIGYIHQAGISEGCADNRYCPDDLVTREQAAVLILKALHGAYHVPADLPPAGSSFSDVNSSATWIEEFFNLGFSAGCATAPLRYCPKQILNRAQLAVFILKALEGQSYVPPAVGSSSFVDVIALVDWIEEFYQRGFTVGCANSPLRYCPNDGLTRDQLAFILARAFALPGLAQQGSQSN